MASFRKTVEDGFYVALTERDRCEEFLPSLTRSQLPDCAQQFLTNYKIPPEEAKAFLLGVYLGLKAENFFRPNEMVTGLIKSMERASRHVKPPEGDR